MLLIVNARAGSVSNRTREVIAKALAADFKLEVADTTHRNHAIELGRDAVDRGFDAVLAFGGDGTVNEAAQALVGSDVALGVLPGGSTNVLARSTGVPRDPVEATAFVAAHLRSGARRRINVGRLNDRYFLFSAGMGLDAEVVKRVEADPEGKRRSAEWTFMRNAVGAGFSKFRGAAPGITVEVPGEPSTRALFAICCNARPFTYFKRWPVDACPGAALDKGLDLLTLDRVRTSTIPRIAWSVFVTRSHPRWKKSRYWHDIDGASLTPDAPTPVQVDGDYIGDLAGAAIALVPAALDLLV